MPIRARNNGREISVLRRNFNNSFLSRIETDSPRTLLSPRELFSTLFAIARTLIPYVAILFRSTPTLIRRGHREKSGKRERERQRYIINGYAWARENEIRIYPFKYISPRTRGKYRTTFPSTRFPTEIPSRRFESFDRMWPEEGSNLFFCLLMLQERSQSCLYNAM